MSKISREQAQSAKDAALRRFGRLEHLTGVGITRVKGEYAVKVNLSEPVAEGEELPDSIEGVPLCVEVTGVVRAR
jgi:hypothetical protein